MEFKQEHYKQVEKYLPKQRGNVRINNIHGKTRGGFATKIHTVLASEKVAINFFLSDEQANDSLEGSYCKIKVQTARSVKEKIGLQYIFMLSDSACTTGYTQTHVKLIK